MYRLLLIILFVFTTSQNLNAQNFENELSSSNTYEALTILFNTYNNDSLKGKLIASQFTTKAKLEKDSIKIAKGYSYLAQVSEASEAKKYLDSTIFITKHSKDIQYPGEGYLQKSNYLFNKDEFKESLKSAISAYHSAENKNNIDQQISALHQINKVNELWGDYRKALETEFLAYKLLEDNMNKELFSEHYLYSLEGIGKSYARLKKNDSALIYFKKGIDESLKRKDSSSYYAFVSRTGMALYGKKQYKAALDSLHKGDINRALYNNSYLPFYYFYVGSSYLGQAEKEKGIAYLKKTDSIFDANNTLQPELPFLYDHLVTYYQDQGNEKKQLEYLYKLVAIERTIGTKRTSIKNETENEYVIPKLLKDKNELIDDLNTKNKTSKLLSWGIFLLLVISVLFLFYYVKRQKKFKKRFDVLIANQEKEEKEEEKTKTEGIEENNNGISIHIIQGILEQLDQFEANNGFLSQDISQVKLSKSFKTNSTYLSKVINLKKDKNFSQYINDLRVDYFMKEIKVNEKFKKFTIKALANECGFKSAESFSKAFYKKHGIYPSYFLNQLGNKKK